MGKKRSVVYFISLFVIILLTAGVVQAKTIGQGVQNNCITLVQTCSNCSFVNITSISFPPNNTLVNYVPQLSMTKIGTDFNYSFCSTSKAGNYIYNTLGDPDGEIQNEPVSFEITPSGYSQTTSQGITSAIVLFTVLIAGGFLLFGGFKLLESHNLWFFGIVVIALGVVMMIYSLGLSIVYTRDLAYTSGTSVQQEKIFRTALRGVQILFLFTLPMLAFYLFNIYKTKKNERERNDGWDNNSY